MTDTDNYDARRSQEIERMSRAGGSIFAAAHHAHVAADAAKLRPQGLASGESAKEAEHAERERLADEAAEAEQTDTDTEEKSE